MTDLSRYVARVEAAESTGQCLDYAADVRELLAEVVRLRAGIRAVEDHYAFLYRQSTLFGKHDHAALREWARRAEEVERVLDLMHRAMGGAEA